MVIRACIAAGAALAGCAGATTTGSTVTGSTLKVYASQPPQAAGSQQAQDALDAERLALQQAGSHVGRFNVVLEPVTGATVSDHARTAIADSSAIAYLGELSPHSSADSIGITNAVGLLQVSPGDTALELTQPTRAVPNSPTRYYQSIKTYGRTFGRVVPAINREAAAQALAMLAQRVKRLYVADDGGPYGKAIALAVTNAATAKGISATRGSADAKQVASSGADALFLGADNQTSAAALFNAVASASPTVKLFGPSALASDTFVRRLSAGAQAELDVSEPGFIQSGPRASLTPAGRGFVASFKATYHRQPGQSAIFGYEAMELVLDVLRRAGTSAGSRSAVVTEFHRTTNRASVLGTYSIDVNGDTSLAPYTFSRVRTTALVPFESMQG